MREDRDSGNEGERMRKEVPKIKRKENALRKQNSKNKTKQYNRK